MKLNKYFNDSSYLELNIDTFPNMNFETRKEKEKFNKEKFYNKNLMVNEREYDSDKKTFSNKSTNDEEFIQALKNINKAFS